MKNFFLTVLFVLISSISFAEQGEIKQHGIFTGQSKLLVMTKVTSRLLTMG